jgi:hypothetical protein
MYNVGWQQLKRRHDKDCVPMNSTEISRIALHFLRIRQRVVVPPASHANYPRPRRSLYRKASRHSLYPKVAWRTLTAADVAAARAGSSSFSQTNSSVRLRPSESIRCRMACRSPTVETPPSHDIAANSPNFSPHSHVPRPDCGDCPRDRGPL